jgi:hypothetical protein
MKFNFFKILIFILLLFTADKAIGFICKKLYAGSNDFFISKLRHTLNAANEDVLILGSSRAEYHFIPGIIRDSTGLSVYNCGIGGADLLFSRIQLSESLKRYKPKYIIIEASPSSFYIPNADNNRKMLLPFYKNDTLVYNTLTNHRVFEKIKFVSSIYPYNSTIVSLVKGFFKENTDSLNGFLPADGVIDTAGMMNTVDESFSSSSLPPEKFIYLKQLIDVCEKNNIKLIVASSPVYLANINHDEMVEQIKTFCGQFKNLVYVDYSKLEKTYMQQNFFKDNSHLNYDGAKIFSTVFAEDFKKIRAFSE